MDDELPALRPMPWLLLAAAAYLVADILAMVYGSNLQDWFDLQLDWNWTGKACSIALSAVVLACSPWLRRGVGLTWRQAPGSLRLSLGWFVFCLAIGVFFGLVGPPVPRSTETLAYQAVMPGISEELAYRGIALALLERAFGRSPMSCRLRFGLAGAITSLVFTLGHVEVYSPCHGALRSSGWRSFSARPRSTLWFARAVAACCGQFYATAPGMAAGPWPACCTQAEAAWPVRLEDYPILWAVKPSD